MLVKILTPSAVDGEVLVNGSAEPGVIGVVEPKRWSSKQQVLTVAPVMSCTASGAVVDRVILTVNQKTGKLSISRVSADTLDCEIDEEEV